MSAIRPQPKFYARIHAYGLDTLVALSDVSRISIESETDANEFEYCVVIYYTDAMRHVLASNELASRENGGRFAHKLLGELAAAVVAGKGADITESQ